MSTSLPEKAAPSFGQVYDLQMKALHDESPGHISAEEAQGLVDLLGELEGAAAEGSVTPKDVEDATDILEQLYSSSRVEGSPRHDGVDQGDAYSLSLDAQQLLEQKLGLEPRAPASAEIAEQLRGLHSQLVPYGRGINQVGVPSPLLGEAYPVDDVSLSIGAENVGTGISLGNGFVLTNRHVFQKMGTTLAEYAAPHFGPTPMPLAPGAEMDSDWTLLGTPGAVKRTMDEEELGTIQDWTLLQKDSLKGRPAPAVSFRATEDLGPDEQVWFLGDRTEGKTRLSTGRLLNLYAGTNAKLVDAEGEGGFSGSPVIDAQGRIVGLVFAKVDANVDDQGNAQPAEIWMMTTEALVNALDQTRTVVPDVPVLTLERDRAD
jgi:hypothetical protein